MSSVSINGDVKKLFIVAFREIFARDLDFTYNKGDMKSSPIIITSKYAIPESESKVPQIIVSTSGYGTQPSGFYNNFFKTEVIEDNGMKKERATYSNIVSFNITLDVMSTNKPECELVADKVFNALNHEYAWAFKSLNMNIRSVQVGEPVPKQQYPQYSFISTVSISGDFNLTWKEVPTPDRDIILNSIKLILNTETII